MANVILGERTGPARDWTPPWTLEERLKEMLVPPRLGIWRRVRRALRSGERELHLLPFLVPKGCTALDVGANKGVFSYLLRGLTERVHAFEPNPKQFAILRRWTRNTGVDAHFMALSSRTGTAELRVPRGSHGGYSNQGASLSTTKVADDSDFSTVAVRSSRLDDFAAELGLSDIGFIKIDVEGFELDVLAGAQEILRRDRPSLLVEMEESHTGRGLTDLVGAVQAYGYRCLYLDDGVLRDFSAMDVDTRHRRPARREDYVFNFIFLPTAPAAVRR